MFDFDDFTDVYDFPEEYDSFRDFDNLLRCPICKEFLNPALILSSCQHYGCRYEWHVKIELLINNYYYNIIWEWKNKYVYWII